MIRFAADENFNNHILRGIVRKDPSIDITRIQDEGLIGTSDRDILLWCVEEDRILLTQDIRTIPVHVEELIEKNITLPGIIYTPMDLRNSDVIEDVLLISECGRKEDFENVIIYLPL